MLKKKLQEAHLHFSGDENDADGPTESGGSRTSTSRQRRFKTSDRTDNLYFGTPGLASIVSDVSSRHAVLSRAFA